MHHKNMVRKLTEPTPGVAWTRGGGGLFGGHEGTVCTENRVKTAQAVVSLNSSNIETSQSDQAKMGR